MFEEAAQRPLLSGGAPLPPEDALVLEQDELHDLVLVHHVHRDVARLRLGPQQRGPEHDGHARGGHAVGLAVVNHPKGGGGSNTRWDLEMEQCRDWFQARAASGFHFFNINKK